MLPVVILAVAGIGMWAASQGGVGGILSTAQPNTANRGAFLAALRISEGTASAGDPYSVLFGGGSFADHTDHPTNTGEWPGVQTQWGHTTAAGAYQFEVGTWNGLGGIGSYGSFDAAAQDQAALDLIRQCGALALVDEGNITAAVGKLGTQWASLPSSTAGQPTVAMVSFLTSYQANGGSVAVV